MAVQHSLLEVFSGKPRRCWKILPRFSSSGISAPKKKYLATPPPLPTDIPPDPFPLLRLLLGTPPPSALFQKTGPSATSLDASSLSPTPEQKKKIKIPKRPPMGSQQQSPNVKTFCTFEPQIWPEIITSRDAESTCFKGSRTSCDVIIFHIFWPEKITSRDGCFLPSQDKK